MVSVGFRGSKRRLSFVFLLPALLDLLEMLDPFINLADLVRIELEQCVTEFQHPLLAGIVRLHLDLVCIGNLNLPPSKRPNCQTLPRQKLNRHEVDVRCGHLRAVYPF